MQRRFYSVKVLSAVLLLGYAAVVFGPVLATLFDSFNRGSGRPEAWWTLAIPVGRRLSLLFRSLGFSAAVALSGTLLGLFAAVRLWQWRSGPARSVQWLVWAMAPVPVYIHGLAWSSAITAVDAFLSHPGLAPPVLAGWGISWWVEVMAYTPLAAGLCLLGLEAVDPALMEAARTMRPDFQVFLRIVLPLAAHAVVTAAALLFVISITDYSLPSLFAVSVYSLEIFADYSATHQSARALALALPLLCATGVVAALAASAVKDAGSKVGRAGAERPLFWPTWFSTLTAAALLLLAAQILVPGITLAVSTGSWRNLADTLAKANREISFTSWIAFFAAIACLPFALATGMQLSARNWNKPLWWGLVTFPLAVPAPLVGIGLISLSNSVPPSVHVTEWMPVLAALARFTPFAALVCLAQLKRVDPLLIDAARVHQRNSVHGWIQVRIPILAPGLVAAAGLVFALTIGELGATLLVAPPGRASLAMRVYNYMHYGASGQVAGLCLAMAFAVVLATVLALGCCAGWNRLALTGQSRKTNDLQR